MNTMKRTFALSIAFLLASVVLLAEPASPRRYSNRLMNDVVQMTRAGLTDSTIIAYVKARRSRLADVRADDLISLRQQGVSEPVVAYIAGAASVEGGDYDRESQMDYQSQAAPDDGGTYADEPSYPVDGYDGSYGYPYWYAWGYPYWYGYWPYSSVFIGGRFGRFRGGHGGHFGGHGGFHGGGGHGGGGRGGRH
jgi:uncharacterized membrane protein YgcG